jgi:hypothetical protein
MSNHGDEPFDHDPEQKKHFDAIQGRNKLMRDLLQTTGFRGALGEFPEGQLTKSDEGAIQFAIGSKDGKVVLDFGTSVHWVGMTPQQAADLASTLLKKAREVGRMNGESVGFTIG